MSGSKHFAVLQNFLKPVLLISNIVMDKLLALQWATGTYVNEITDKELRNLSWRPLPILLL